jgi:hypothetical protein
MEFLVLEFMNNSFLAFPVGRVGWSYNKKLLLFDNTSATSDKYLIMKKLQNIRIFRNLLIVKN